MKRGSVIHRARNKQIIDFSGLRYGNITPTDIDGMIEYKNKYFIFLELKYKDAQMPRGQRLAFTRMVLNLKVAGKPSVLFVASHDVENTDKDIDASKAMVTKMYHPADGLRPSEWWQRFLKPTSLKTAVDVFIESRQEAWRQKYGK